VRMHELLAARGVMGLTVGAIGTQLEAEGLGVTRQTIHKWLRADTDRCEKTGKYGRWKAVRS
jgi:predicted transcriptional regulator